MTTIQDIEYFLLDLDGTFYLGNELIDGALRFLHALEQKGKRYLFLTNNSSKNKSAYRSKLLAMGCDVDEEKIFTSGEATTIYLNGLKPDSKVFLLGTPLLEEEFRKAGFQLVNYTDDRPDFVVLGFDTTLTYDKLWKACDWIRNDIPYVATHPDFNCPLEEGRFMPDAGAMIDLIAASTGKRPHVVGKPSQDIIDAIYQKYGFQKQSMAMIGDRLYTDIMTGANAGITSILVLTGETTMEDYNASNVTADYIYASIKEISDDLLAEFEVSSED